MNMVVNFFKSKMDKVIIRPGFRLPLMGDVTVTQKKLLICTVLQIYDDEDYLSSGEHSTIGNDFFKQEKVLRNFVTSGTSLKVLIFTQPIIKANSMCVLIQDKGR